MKRILLLCILIFISISIGGAETLRRVQAYADRGDRDAQFKLGLWYYSGYKVERDLDSAAFYFNLSAAQNHLDALFLLGYMTYYGEGIEQNVPLGLQYFGKAASLGHIEAQFDLGYIYYNGLMTEQDRERGLKLIKQSADGGFKKAKDFILNLS